jgi:hypothetical protein
MNEAATNRHLVRFGAFELDLKAGELRKNGLKIKLQEQPFQVLAILLGRPGDVVTREELQKAVWPADTFVDFDRGVEQGDQQDSGSAGRQAGQSTIRGNAAPAGIPIRRSPGHTRGR